MQQRLRGDAADVETDAAERRAALDEHDLLAEIGGAERGGIAARAGAEHQKVAFEIGLFASGLGRRRGRRGRRRGGRGSAAEGAAAAGVGADEVAPPAA